MEAGSQSDGSREIDVKHILDNELRLGAHFTAQIIWVEKWKRRIFFIFMGNVLTLLAVEITLAQIWPEEAWYFIGGQFVLLVINNVVQQHFTNRQRLQLIFNRRHPFEF